MKSIARRLVAIERRLAPPSAVPQVIIISGGAHGGEPTHATAGDMTWERAPVESFADFQARAVAAATAAGERFVVIGGIPLCDLPMMPFDGDK